MGVGNLHRLEGDALVEAKKELGIIDEPVKKEKKKDGV